ncbi:hypothetical protein [Pseudodonghicola xiamenensis]|uniref:DUF2946 domain-containing protein n=1 Tax=Pseudodonghicola xiamenensis TaxID=337702 RepID=A0A8J3HAR5_9RHOB|nr:hypothetical protein [Pseudodonghicola xiamenensis]GHG96534.1 hypothetical protein GCM10010961_30800 [Pseudodonghicola xiamenensis]
MKALGSLRLFGVLLVMVLTIATGALGFAHRLPSADQQALDAYVLAGGNPADICGGAGGNRDDHHCPACSLTGAVVPPDPVGLVHRAEYHYIAQIITPRENRAVRAVLDPALGLRAPPLA